MLWIADNRLFFSSPKKTCKIYCRYESESGRKYWFFSSANEIFGPFDSLAEAEEELSEYLVARKYLLLKAKMENAAVHRRNVANPLAIREP